MKPMNRRSLIAGAFASAGLAAFDRAAAVAQQRAGNDAPISPKDNLKVTKLETFLVKPRWLFLKVHTNAGIVGLGEPITEGRALTCAEAVKEIEPYLIGKDPRRVARVRRGATKCDDFRDLSQAPAAPPASGPKPIKTALRCGAPPVRCP